MTTDPTPRDAGTQPAPARPANARRIPFTTLINLLLFVGLVVLYALYFLQLKGPADEEDTQEQLTEMQEQIARAGASFAYVSSDRLMEEYDLAIRMREEFEGEQRRLESDLERRQRTFQNEVERFQQNIQAGTISMDQAQIREQELMQMQQELIQSSDTYRERLARKEFEMNLELLEKISEFLGRYNREAGYDFILSYSTGGGILFADPRHDITAEVVERLNNEHANTQ
jgi:outer membrane protein